MIINKFGEGTKSLKKIMCIEKWLFINLWEAVCFDELVLCSDFKLY